MSQELAELTLALARSDLPLARKAARSDMAQLWLRMWLGAAPPQASASSPFFQRFAATWVAAWSGGTWPRPLDEYLTSEDPFVADWAKLTSARQGLGSGTANPRDIALTTPALESERALLFVAWQAVRDPTCAYEDGLALLRELTGQGLLETAARLQLVLARIAELNGDLFERDERRSIAKAHFEGMALSLRVDERANFLSAPWRSWPFVAEVRPVAVAAEREELSDRVQRIFDITRRLACERNLDRLLERIADACVELTGAERAYVLLPNADGALEPRLVRGSGLATTDPSVTFSVSIAESVRIDGAPLVTVDAGEDSRLQEFVSVHAMKLKSVACVPIRGATGITGVLYLEDRLRRARFAAADLQLLVAFGDQAAIAIENARLLTELETRATALEESNRALSAARSDMERVLVARTDELRGLEDELERTRSQGARSQYGILGQSAAMEQVFALLHRLRASEASVIIQGESGTGKELVASAIHAGSIRKKGPFVALNCAAIPEGLIESELFGTARGAFTGADRERRGVFELAHGGTLFLDEIGDMPPRMQVDLLRVLQEGRVRRVGGHEDITIDVRVVCASHKRLPELVREGMFREDLYYRLCVVELYVPPLREREDDVVLLAEYFLAKQPGPRKHLSPDALASLRQHAFPGNVRELEHRVTRASLLCESDKVSALDLGLVEDFATRVKPVTSEMLPVPATTRQFKDAEHERILKALELCQWNRARAARALEMPRRTFYRRLKEYGIV